MEYKGLYKRKPVPNTIKFWERVNVKNGRTMNGLKF